MERNSMSTMDAMKERIHTWRRCGEPDDKIEAYLQGALFKEQPVKRGTIVRGLRAMRRL